MVFKLWMGESLWLLTMFMVGSHGAHFSYTPDDQSYPCIMMDAVFTVKINAVRYTRTIASDFHTSEDEIIDITGSCGANTAIMNLAFNRGGVTWSFIFRIKENAVTLDRLIQFVPKNVFASYVTNISDPITFDDPNTLDLSFKNESYYCKSKRESSYFPIKPIPGATSFYIRTDMKHVRLQAFNMKRGHYSREVLCHNDIANVTTRAPTTTPMATSTTQVLPTNAPDNFYYVYNRQNTTLCIAMTGRIDVNIRYEYNTSEGVVGKRTLSFPIPNNATWYGSCDLPDGTQNIVIEFFKPMWTLEFIFRKKIPGSNSTPTNVQSGKTQKQLDYRIESINLMYMNDRTNFPDSISPEGNVVRDSSTVEEKQYPRKSSGKGYYVCSSFVKLKIDKNAAITTEEFKFKAFNENYHKNFEGSSSRCSADITDNTRRAIIIVCSVIGVIILIIIAIVVVTIVGRRGRRRRQYRQIRGNDKPDFVYH